MWRQGNPVWSGCRNSWRSRRRPVKAVKGLNSSATGIIGMQKRHGERSTLDARPLSQPTAGSREADMNPWPSDNWEACNLLPTSHYHHSSWQGPGASSMVSSTPFSNQVLICVCNFSSIARLRSRNLCLKTVIFYTNNLYYKLILGNGQ